MAVYPYYPYQYGNSYYPSAYQPLQAQSQSPSGIIWVSGLQEAQFYPVAPNSAVALWEQSGKTVYIKQSDATGKPTMRIYDLIERTDSAPVTQDGKQDDYATKSELTAFAESLKSLAGDIETMKGDLYGVAGRKKPSRKVEVEENDI